MLLGFNECLGCFSTLFHWCFGNEIRGYTGRGDLQGRKERVIISIMSNSALTAALLTGLLLAGGSVYADPTGEQQYYLELLNRVRLDPAAELQRMVNLSAPGVWGSPMSDDADVNGSLGLHGTSAAELWSQWSAISAAPAVAWSDSLAASAMAYSGLMASMDSQSHTLDGLDLGTRFTNYGYSADYLDLGQNLYAGAASTRHALSAFLIDWGDDDGDAGNGYGTGLQAGATHRNLALDPVMKEFGLGLETLRSGTADCL
jgi:hypothetical protein